jgi:hypothetical protein
MEARNQQGSTHCLAITSESTPSIEGNYLYPPPPAPKLPGWTSPILTLLDLYSSPPPLSPSRKAPTYLIPLYLLPLSPPPPAAAVRRSITALLPSHPLASMHTEAFPHPRPQAHTATNTTPHAAWPAVPNNTQVLLCCRTTTGQHNLHQQFNTTCTTISFCWPCCRHQQELPPLPDASNSSTSSPAAAPAAAAGGPSTAAALVRGSSLVLPGPRPRQRSKALQERLATLQVMGGGGR